jgi:hypothetical protein
MALRKAPSILLAACLLWAPEAVAHDWYPVWCCSDRDCRELVEDMGETVLEVPQGWQLWDGRIVSRKSAKRSPDNRFHLCEELTTKAIICFFVPPGAS